jgi:hypothetical protein
MRDQGKAEGYVKLWRMIMDDGRIFKDSETFHLGAYCIMKANFKRVEIPFNRQLLVLERGQFVSGRNQISRDTGISEKRVRSRLEFLENIGFLARKRASRFTIITVENYDYYQGSDSNEGPEIGPTKGQQRATDKKYKKEKNVLNIECNDFERLGAFLSSLPQYQSFPLEARELILEFVNRIRASNKTGGILGGRVSDLVSRFQSIQERTNPESLLAGLKGAFRKAERDGFDFKKRDPTGYVHAVARSHRNEMERSRQLAPALEEQKALRSVAEGRVFQEFKAAFNLNERSGLDERKEETNVPLPANHSNPVQAH